MTEQNALRHYISKAHKVKKRKNYEEMCKLYNEAGRIIDVPLCENCPCEDFGMCGLRFKKIPAEELVINYCFDSFIVGMEKMLKWLQSW
jgi:hypothetical protein